MPKITELYAVVDETDGIVAAKIGEGWFPMVFSNEANLEVRIRIAQSLADSTGKPLTLAKFSNRIDYLKIKPK